MKKQQRRSALLIVLLAACEPTSEPAPRYSPVAWYSPNHIVAFVSREQSVYDMQESNCAKRELVIVNTEAGGTTPLLSGGEWCRVLGEATLVGSARDAGELYFVQRDSEGAFALLRWDPTNRETTTIWRGCVRENVSLDVHPISGELIVPMTCADRHRREHLFVIDTVGQSRLLLAADSGSRAIDPVWHPSQPKVAYALGSISTSDLPRIVEVDIPTRERQTYGAGIRPSYSPDGRFLAYVALTPSSSPALEIVGQEQKVEVRLSFDDRSVTGPILWAEDASYLLFSARTQGRPEVWKYGIETQVASRVLPPPSSLSDGVDR